MIVYLILHFLLAIPIVVWLYKESNDGFEKIFFTIIGVVFSWVGLLGLLLVELLTMKYKRNKREIDAARSVSHNEYKWEKLDYKLAEEMLLKKGSVLVLKEGDRTIPVPDHLKKDFYAFVNKGLTSTSNYDTIPRSGWYQDNMFISSSQYIHPFNRDGVIINIGGG